MDPMDAWRTVNAENELWGSKGKRKVQMDDPDVNLSRNLDRNRGQQFDQSDELERRIRPNSDDSVSNSNSSSSSNWNSSSRASSSKSSSSSSSRSSSSNSSSSSHSRTRSTRRGQKSKRQVPCIRTLFYDRNSMKEEEQLGHSAAVPVGRYENDATTRASEVINREFQNAVAAPDIVNHEYSNNEANSNESIQRKSSWRRLRPRRLISSIFNLPRNGSGFLSSPEVELMLVNVNMHQSPGPIRLVLNRKESVHRVIELALQAYDDQQRQPPLSPRNRRFILYCQTPEFEAMDEKSCIGDYNDCRNFYLYPKAASEEEMDTTTWTRIRSDLCSFKTWFGKSIAEIQYWGLCMLSTVGRNLGYVASSLYCLNLDSIIGRLALW